MPVPEQIPHITYTTDGRTTDFPLTFDCPDQSHLIVSLDDIEPAVGQWSLIDNTVVFLMAPASNQTLSIERNTPLERTRTYKTNDNSFRPTALNKDFDYIWRKLQELGYKDSVLLRMIVKEIADRKTGDRLLSAKIAAEEVERIGADSFLQSQIKSNDQQIDDLYKKLAKEILYRIDGDREAKRYAKDYVDFMMTKESEDMPIFSGVADNIVITENGDTQRDMNRKTITKVNSIDDLISLQNIEGNTVYVQSRGIYRYSIKDNQWLPDLITERQIITVFSFQEMNSLDRWNNRTVYLSGIGMYVYNQSSAKWIKTASISKRTSEYNIVASNTSDDNTAQIYALLEKDTVFVVDTTVCLNTPLLIDKTLTFVCEGQGMILIGDQMTEKEAINVQAPLTKLHDLRCDNPLKLKSATGGKQTCVSIQADNVTVSKSVFYRMLHSCAVQPRSVLLKEVQGTKYLDNYAFECIGVGAGDNDDGSNNYGEDRGDAFVCWGAKAMMVGNYAYAGEGEDCRIAFHCEGLGDFVPPENQTKFDNSDYVIANNYAFGSFRRHFVFEAVQRGQMSNLISDGGATWWAFAFPQSHHCTVNNITIRYDRKNSTAGAAWKPVRGAIGLLNDNSGLRFNNVQIIMDDTDDDAFVVRDSATGKHDVQINNINIKGTRLSKGFGFNIIGSTRLNVTNFSIDNMIMAFYSYGAESIKIKNGEVTGADYLFNSQNNVDFSAKDIDNTKGKIIFNNGGKGDIQDIRFKEMDGTDFEIYAWTFDKIRIKNCSSDRAGGGLFSVQGTKDIINSDSALDYRDNENFKTKVQTTTILLGSLTSKVNTNYKGQGKTVFVGTDVYISTGGLASDMWVSMSGKTSITPA